MAKGDQWMSWIHIDDIAGIFRLSIDNDGASGPLNGTAPNPVRNSEFAKTFSSVLKKPYTPWRFYLPVGPPDANAPARAGRSGHHHHDGANGACRRSRWPGLSVQVSPHRRALQAVFTPRSAAAAAGRHVPQPRRRRGTITEPSAQAS